jgi:hypothetical protein
MLTEQLKSAISQNIPLAEIGATIKSGISPEVACEAINRISPMMVAYPYPTSMGKSGGTIFIQLHPCKALRLGLELRREARVPNPGLAGYCWECDNCNVLEYKFMQFIENPQLSQPGQFDDGRWFDMTACEHWTE